jgi:hypothetical protein
VFQDFGKKSAGYLDCWRFPTSGGAITNLHRDPSHDGRWGRGLCRVPTCRARHISPVEGRPGGSAGQVRTTEPAETLGRCTAGCPVGRILPRDLLGYRHRPAVIRTARDSLPCAQVMRLGHDGGRPVVLHEPLPGDLA